MVARNLITNPKPPMMAIPKRLVLKDPQISPLDGFVNIIISRLHDGRNSLIFKILTFS